MKKVTNSMEPGAEIFDEVQHAVRRLYGAREPDLEQEARLRTLVAFRKSGAVRHPRAFVWKIVRDTLADHWREKLRPAAELVELDAEEPTDPRNPEDDLDRRQRFERLREAMLDLAADVRAPLYLFYVEDYPIRTIARLYGKSPSAIKMALLRGRRRLRRIVRASATNISAQSRP